MLQSYNNVVFIYRRPRLHKSEIQITNMHLKTNKHP